MSEILHVATFDTICSLKFATNYVDRGLPRPFKILFPNNILLNDYLYFKNTLILKLERNTYLFPKL